MSEFLSQDEIHALLDVVDDTEAYQKNIVLDEAAVKDIGTV